MYLGLFITTLGALAEAGWKSEPICIALQIWGLIIAISFAAMAMFSSELKGK